MKNIIVIIFCKFQGSRNVWLHTSNLSLPTTSWQ